MDLTIKLPQRRVSFCVSLEVRSRADHKEDGLTRVVKKNQLLQQVEKDISRSREKFGLLI